MELEPGNPRRDTGEAVLIGVAAAAATAVLAIEALGVLGLIRPITLVGVGGLAIAVLFGVMRPLPVSVAGIRSLTRPEWALGGATVFVLAVSLLIATVAPPNTWDSMTYHMARVAHWLDQGSLAYYQTSIDRQLWQPPFAEYFITVVYGALGGRDYLANMPQWMGAVAVVLTGSLIARALGAPRVVQFMAAFIVAMSPSFILQSNSTQNDLLSALWVSIVAYWALAQWACPSSRRDRVVGFGLALGLAIGTKGTSLAIALPWVIAFLVADWRAVGPRPFVARALAIAVLVVGLNAGPWARSTAVFGTPFGPASVHRLLRPESTSPAAVGSNLITNLSLHFGTPWKPVNASLERGITGLHARAGVDTEVLYPYFGGFRIVPWSTHEDLAGSPVHIVLGLLGAGFVVFGWRRLVVEQRVAVACLAGSWLMFFLLIRWQPYNSRLHLPLVVLTAPLIALLLRRFPIPITGAVLGMFALGAAPALLSNQTRPIIALVGSSPTGDRPPSIFRQSRASAYFNARPDLEPVYQRLVREVGQSECPAVGLTAGYDSWEYPLWAQSRSHGVRFIHLTPVETATEHRPCLVLGLDQEAGWPGPPGYRPSWRFGEFSVWSVDSKEGGLP